MKKTKKNCGTCLYAVDAGEVYPGCIRSFSLVCTFPIIAPKWLSYPNIQRATEPEKGEDCCCYERQKQRKGK